jgi:hypothetical protein
MADTAAKRPAEQQPGGWRPALLALEAPTTANFDHPRLERRWPFSELLGTFVDGQPDAGQ